MKEGIYAINKAETFLDCGLLIRAKGWNCHHIIFKSDFNRRQVPNDFNVNKISNLIPLKIEVHNQLHQMIEERCPNDLSLRVYMANMAFNDELDLVSSRVFRTNLL